MSATCLPHIGHSPPEQYLVLTYPATSYLVLTCQLTCQSVPRTATDQQVNGGGQRRSTVVDHRSTTAGPPLDHRRTTGQPPVNGGFSTALVKATSTVRRSQVMGHGPVKLGSASRVRYGSGFGFWISPGRPMGRTRGITRVGHGSQEEIPPQGHAWGEVRAYLDVDAQTRFEITSKKSNDPPLSRGYTLGSGEDNMKLLELMELCTQLSYKNRKSVLFLLLVYIKTAKLMLMLLGSVNAARHMLMLPVQVPAAEALVDKKKVIITESSIRSDLHLDDAEGTDCLPTATIFEELARIVFINQQLGDMSQHKKIFVNPFHTKKVFANMKRAGKDFSRRITPLFDTIMVQASEEVGVDSDYPTDSNQIPIVDQPSTFSQPKQKQKSRRRRRKEAEVPQDETEHEESVLDLEKAKDTQVKEIAALKKRVQRLERKKTSRTTVLKRLKKVGMSKRVESSEDQVSLGDHKDASKQGRSIADIDADVKVTLVDETQERRDEDLMFDTGVLDSDEMPMEAKIDEKDKQSTKLDDNTAGEAVTIAGVEGSAASTTIEEITLAQTLILIKAAKPKVVTTASTTTITIRPKVRGVVVQEPSEFRISQEESQPSTSITKDKRKAIMVEPEAPLKRKGQVALDEQLARDVQAHLEAELIEEEKLARKQEEEANIALIESWDNTQAMMEADFELAQRLQTEEQEEYLLKKDQDYL
ncbi:hypothetical protein Tco_0016425 [Tanacetum coccineum]